MRALRPRRSPCRGASHLGVREADLVYIVDTKQKVGICMPKCHAFDFGIQIRFMSYCLVYLNDSSSPPCERPCSDKRQHAEGPHLPSPSSANPLRPPPLVASRVPAGPRPIYDRREPEFSSYPRPC